MGIKELLTADILRVYQTDKYFFVRIRPEDGVYDNSIEQVDKKTLSVEHTFYIDFMVLYRDKATEIDVSDFKEFIRSII